MSALLSRHGSMLHLGLPEAVQVAVGICSPQLGGGPEDGLGLRAREDELYTILSINAYE